MKIYTGSGDYGTTFLTRGTEVSKDDVRVETYGTIDELNSFIGLLALCRNEPFLEEIQTKLFYVGGYFADETAVSSGITDNDISALESQIDLIESQLMPTDGFILPRGSQASCLCHICRTVCRRAERRMVTYKNSVMEETERNVYIYMNRLSDYFFLLAKCA